LAEKFLVFREKATQTVSYAPNRRIKLRAKPVVNAEDVIEELPTPVPRRAGKSRTP
jgi:hypothetical protein